MVKDPTKYSIATFGSHTALQILKGAKDEGFHTICIALKGRSQPYRSFNVADEIIEIETFDEFFKVEAALKQKNAILIPHGSLVQFLGPDNIERISMMHFGTRGIIKWEADRSMQRKWLDKAKLNLPRIFKSPQDIDRTVIVKFHGAAGGRGYFLAHSAEEFQERYDQYAKEHGDSEYVIQEYIVGVPVYTHYFYSPLTKEIEIMSFDKRYESNADSVGRIAARDQIDVQIQTSYTITGNMPLVLRESLLPSVFEMGERVVQASQAIEPPHGLYGPFCLEAIVDNRLNFYVFEISARIVAGTNPYTNGSPYTWLKYDVPMSTGRRVAREIKNAIGEGRLDEVLG